MSVVRSPCPYGGDGVLVAIVGDVNYEQSPLRDEHTLGAQIVEPPVACGSSVDNNIHEQWASLSHREGDDRATTDEEIVRPVRIVAGLS